MSKERKKLGRPLNPKWKEWDSKLGTMADHIIASKMGLCLQAVANRRNKLGIPPLRRHLDYTGWH